MSVVLWYSDKFFRWRLSIPYKMVAGRKFLLKGEKRNWHPIPDNTAMFRAG